MYRLMMETEHRQCDELAIQCRIRLLDHKYMQETKSSKARVTSGTRRDKQNRFFRIINEMSLTFVFVYHENAMFSCSNGKYVIIVQIF